MAVIGITLDEVIRDFVGQLIYVYEKYNDDVDLEIEDVKTFNFMDNFKFDSINDMNRFLYSNSALEVFGHANELEDNLMTLFNIFLMDIKDDEEHTIQIVNREVDKAIPSTLFFLSKLGCRADNIRFVDTYERIWDGVDVLISANPTTLNLKPKGKMSIKVKSHYNDDVDSDFELDSIREFIGDETLRNKILNSKITRLK